MMRRTAVGFLVLTLPVSLAIAADVPALFISFAGAPVAVVAQAGQGGHAQTARPDSGVSLPPVLWREPGRLSPQHWTCGPGGCDRTPAPPYRFVKEETTGTNPKILVTDAHGLRWSVKFGGEAVPECFASRFVTAAGYLAEPTYCIARGRIDGIGKLHRAHFLIKKDGAFSLARFELRGQPDLVFVAGAGWAWNDNPFLGTRQLAGLKIVVMLLSNWDAADARDGQSSNNHMFRRPDAGKPELLYGITDWGGSLGAWGGFLRRQENDCAAYTRDTPHFIKGVRANQIAWGYSGKRASDIVRAISPEDVRWLLPYLLRISTEDIRTGLRASGATERQTGCWAQAIENRIRQLKAVAAYRP